MPIRAEMIEAVSILLRILSFRAQLFAAFLGAVGLSGWAVHRADAVSILVAGMYTAMVFLPMLFVAYHKG